MPGVRLPCIFAYVYATSVTRDATKSRFPACSFQNAGAIAGVFCALITLRYAAAGDGRVKNPAVMMAKTVDCIGIRMRPSLSLLGFIWGRLPGRATSFCAVL